MLSANSIQPPAKGISLQGMGLIDDNHFATNSEVLYCCTGFHNSVFPYQSFLRPKDPYFKRVLG